MKAKVYERAWELFDQRLAVKTSWGRVELKTLMAECLMAAVSELEE